MKHIGTGAEWNQNFGQVEQECKSGYWYNRLVYSGEQNWSSREKLSLKQFYVDKPF